MTTKTIKTILFASLIAAMILPISGMNFADAKKVPDMTDYESMYEEIFKQVQDKKKSIESDKKELKDNTELSKIQSELIEKKIADTISEITKLNERAAEIQRLNIESYKLDPETQQIFDNAEKTIRDNYLNKNGVYDLFTHSKYRKVVVFVDPNDFANSNYSGGIDAFIAEIKNSVNVDVEVNVAKIILTTHATSCPSVTSPCQPAKGGVQISHANTSGSGSTLGFKAYHPTWGYGFIIAGHEAVATGTSIVQPKNGGTIGTVKVMGSGTCDCAFVQSTGGHSLYDQIWAPDVGTVYPVGVRNVAATPSGTFVMYDGLGSTAQITSVVTEGDKYGYVTKIPSTGDSGAALFQPQTNGNANIYGMMTGGTAQYGLYEPYDWIKADLGLSW